MGRRLRDLCASVISANHGSSLFGAHNLASHEPIANDLRADYQPADLHAGHQRTNAGTDGRTDRLERPDDGPDVRS